MSDVRVTIGATSAGVESEFRKVQRSAEHLKHSANEAFLELEGDHRVKRSLSHIVKEMANAQNATEAFGGALGHLGHVFETSIAAGVGIAALGIFVTKIAAVREEWHKFQEAGEKAMASINQAMQSGEAEKALGEIAKRLEEISAQREKGRGLMAALTGSGGLKQQLELNHQQLEMEEKRVLSADILLDKKQQELQIATLTAEGNVEMAEAIKKQIAITDELNKVNALNLTNTQEELDLREKIIAAIGQKGAQNMRGKPEQQDQQVKDYNAMLAEQNRLSEEAAKVNIELSTALQEVANAEQAVREYMMTDDELIAAARARQASAKADADSTVDIILKQEKLLDVQKEELNILRLMNQQNEKAVQIENDRLKKEQEITQELLKQQLKDAESVVEKGKAQKQARDKAAMQGVIGGESLVMQRANAKVSAAANDKAAGIIARDEARRKVGGDAVKMDSKAAKDFVQKRKGELLGEKPVSDKEIADAARAVPKIQKDIEALRKKLGVK